MTKHGWHSRHPLRLRGESGLDLAERRRQRGELGETLNRVIAATLDEDEEEDWLEDRLDERLSQVDAFIAFLGSSCGCRAKWYGVDD